MLSALLLLALLPAIAAQCTAGNYCPPVNCSASQLLSLPCAPGFVCPENEYPTLCPERHYCPDGVTILDCPEDSYCPTGSVKPIGPHTVFRSFSAHLSNSLPATELLRQGLLPLLFLGSFSCLLGGCSAHRWLALWYRALPAGRLRSLESTSSPR